jgi:hypothetical protein
VARRGCGTAAGAHSQLNRVAQLLTERSSQTLGFETRAERDLMLVLHRPIEPDTPKRTLQALRRKVANERALARYLVARPFISGLFGGLNRALPTGLVQSLNVMIVIFGARPWWSLAGESVENLRRHDRNGKF